MHDQSRHLLRLRLCRVNGFVGADALGLRVNQVRDIPVNADHAQRLAVSIADDLRYAANDADFPIGSQHLEVRNVLAVATKRGLDVRPGVRDVFADSFRPRAKGGAESPQHRERRIAGTWDRPRPADLVRRPSPRCRATPRRSQASAVPRSTRRRLRFPAALLPLVSALLCRVAGHPPASPFATKAIDGVYQRIELIVTDLLALQLDWAGRGSGFEISSVPCQCSPKCRVMSL